MPDDVKTDVDEIQPDKDGKYPETVSWEKYVATKETIGGKLDTERTKVKTLEEAAKTAVNPEEHTKIKTELAEAKTKLQENTEAEKTRQETKLSEMRKTLVAKGVSEDKVKEMEEKELASVELVLGVFKPKADMSPGGGGDTSPASAKSRMQSGFETLHPNK